MDSSSLKAWAGVAGRFGGVGSQRNLYQVFEHCIAITTPYIIVFVKGSWMAPASALRRSPAESAASCH